MAKWGDLRRGADILVKASRLAEFATASGQYLDNDIGCSASLHYYAQSSSDTKEIVKVIETILNEH